MEQQARILKTKFYPVNLDAHQIINDPQRTGGNVHWKYRGQRNIIDLKGARILAHPHYQKFAVIAADENHTRACQVQCDAAQVAA